MRVDVECRSQQNQAIDIIRVAAHVIERVGPAHTFAEKINLHARPLLLGELDHRRNILSYLRGIAEISALSAGKTVAARIQRKNIYPLWI
jgi:hypothetical protein